MKRLPRGLRSKPKPKPAPKPKAKPVLVPVQRPSAKGKLSGEAKAMLVELALSQVGVKEDKKNNTGKQIREYQSATWLAPAPWPWCAAFICWLFREISKEFPLPYERPQTAGAFDFARWAKAQGLKPMTEDGTVEPGDIIIFDFSHIGLAVGYSTGNYITTVEGNTGSDGSRDGDGVWKKRRQRHLVRWIIRP